MAVTNSDSYGNGMFAAMLLAESIGYEGKVAMVYYDADFFTTNEETADSVKQSRNIILILKL